MSRKCIIFPLFSPTYILPDDKMDDSALLSMQSDHLEKLTGFLCIIQNTLYSREENNRAFTIGGATHIHFRKFFTLG